MGLHQTVSIIATHLVVGLREHDGLRTVEGDRGQLLLRFDGVVGVGTLVVLVTVVLSLDELVENTTLVTMLRFRGAHHKMIGLLHIHSFG